MERFLHRSPAYLVPGVARCHPLALLLAGLLLLATRSVGDLISTGGVLASLVV